MKSNILVIAALLCVSSVSASSYEEYIDRYKTIAIREMNDYGIPASITLAQGILESANGTSRLAVEGNNHFGIKCHNDWKGETLTHDDDAMQECFRKYDNPEASFIDHSQFLKTRARYSFLFELDKTDYQAWAKGLKQAGYATDPNYTKLLTDLIERFNLHQYDLLPPIAETTPKLAPQTDPVSGVKYVRAQKDETYYTIGKKYRIPFGLIYVYNDVDKDSRQPIEGDIVYIRAKKSKCQKCDNHVVAEGESMYDISQHYGIKIHKLYDLNNMPYSAKPKVGQILKLH